jgi:hypothetical protein
MEKGNPIRNPSGLHSPILSLSLLLLLSSDFFMKFIINRVETFDMPKVFAFVSSSSSSSSLLGLCYRAPLLYRLASLYCA